jgi:hypothetical protein
LHYDTLCPLAAGISSKLWDVGDLVDMLTEAESKEAAQASLEAHTIRLIRGGTMKSLVAFCAFAVALAGPRMAAQTGHADQIVIQFEIQKNGAVVAKPTLRMKADGQATVTIDNGPAFTVVPTQTDPQTFILVLEFKRPDASPTIRMKLKGQEPNSATVTVGKDSFEIKASVRQLN